MITEDQTRAFLLDLRELTLKHGIYIWGCGCCGSPNLDEISEKDREGEAGYRMHGDTDVEWAGPDKWGWDDLDKSDIVR